MPEILEASTCESRRGFLIIVLACAVWLNEALFLCVRICELVSFAHGIASHCSMCYCNVSLTMILVFVHR